MKNNDFNSISPPHTIPWAKPALIAAGIYNLLWGAVTIAFPNLMFDIANIPHMTYPAIWQCVGMIVGVYGIGYIVAASDHRRHWPIILVGLLGKIFGPIGFAFALLDGTFPPAFGITLLTNDLIWWIPFGILLWDAAKAPGDYPATSDATPPTLDNALDAVVSADGRSLGDLSDHHPTFVLFTRHSGCTFCREALAELSAKKSEIHRRGFSIAIVTMSSLEGNQALATTFDLEDAEWFSDPDRIAYRAFELKRGGFLQLFGPSVLIGGLRALRRGHTVGKLDGDGFQMPGAFVLHNRSIVKAFRHATAADAADVDAMTCELPIHAPS